jgi:hypothetical protein
VIRPELSRENEAAVGYQTLRLCAGGGAFEAIPSPRLQLDLRAAKATLESNAIPVVDARVMLIIQLEPEATLSRDGRLLVKTRSLPDATTAFERLRSLLQLPGIVPDPVAPASDNRYARPRRADPEATR